MFTLRLYIKRLGTVLAGLLLTLNSVSAATAPLKTVPHVDLEKYMGNWYVIANISNYYEKNCYGSTEHYALDQQKNINTLFTCKVGSFTGEERRIASVGYVTNTKTNAEWKVKFWGPIRFQYLIIDMAPDYSYTVVGHPSRKAVWIMARDKKMDDTLYQDILNRLKGQGYDVSKIVKVPQQ